jgi:hypothetical protein
MRVIPRTETLKEKKLIGKRLKMSLAYNKTGELWESFIPRRKEITNSITERTFIWPIADTTKIDSIRMSNGLGSLEEYVNNFGLTRWE